MNCHHKPTKQVLPHCMDEEIEAGVSQITYLKAQNK
jgi:hypothetical protein